MNKFMFRFVKTALTATALIAATVTSSMAAEALRVCSDPDNLPFSKSEGADKGLYIELADMVGQRLGAKVEYVWWLLLWAQWGFHSIQSGPSQVKVTK